MIIQQADKPYPLAAQTITHGGVIAFRTDTFYGLGADPFNREAVQRIKDLKGREEGKPILIVISDLSHVDRFVTQRFAAFDLLANVFWPGPLTLIGRAATEVPEEITAGTATVGLRLPKNDDVRALVRACGGALTATSANRSGGAPARSASEVADCFPSGIDLIVDGGEVTATLPSTVLDLTVTPPRLIREGTISRAEIEQALSGPKSQRV